MSKINLKDGVPAILLSMGPDETHLNRVPVRHTDLCQSFLGREASLCYLRLS
ncbi:MAG: hypothetical protein ACYDEV_08620 [Acidiferrobacter sp.]